MPNQTSRRQKLAERVANSAKDTPEEAAIAKDLLIKEEAKDGVVETKLNGIADAIRAEVSKSLDAQFAIGHLLVEARAMFPGDREFGRWLSAQEFQFGTKTASRLRLGAEREQEVRKFISARTGQSERPIGVEWAMQLIDAPPASVKTGEATPITDTTPQDPAYVAMRTAHRLLVEEGGFATMHVDDMTKVAGFIKALATAYNEEKTKRDL